MPAGVSPLVAEIKGFGIVNPVLNQLPKIRRKDADRLVQLKRAEWVALDQLRLILSHPTNKRVERAAAGYEQIPPDRFLNRSTYATFRWSVSTRLSRERKLPWTSHLPAAADPCESWRRIPLPYGVTRQQPERNQTK